MNEYTEQLTSSESAVESAVACPHCHSNRIRRSRRHRLADWLVIYRLARPYRCRSCGYRFHWSRLSKRH